MTREELIKCLTLLKEQARNSGVNTFVWDISVDSFNFVIDMALKTLEQEPCEDAISKEEVLHRIKVRSDITMDRADETDPWVKGYDAGIEDAIAMIETVPSVHPKVKAGHWIDDCGNLKCPYCETRVSDVKVFSPLTKYTNTCWFCPICGADMREPQESEE